jgi:hypothetical protein
LHKLAALPSLMLFTKIPDSSSANKHSEAQTEINRISAKTMHTLPCTHFGPLDGILSFSCR